MTEDLRTLRKPIHLHLLSGDKGAAEIFDYYKSEIVGKKSNWLSLGIHVHSHKTRLAVKEFKKVFGILPKEISFGHWSYDLEDLKTARKLGVKRDYSWVARKKGERFFVKDPFTKNRMSIIPVACDPLLPVNPFTSWRHFIIFFLLIAGYYFSDRTLHFSFHSYDWDFLKGKIFFSLPLRYIL
jgi:hypothetical protein